MTRLLGPFVGCNRCIFIISILDKFLCFGQYHALIDQYHALYDESLLILLTHD